MLPLFLKPYNVEIDSLIRIGPNSDGGYVIHRDSINLTKKIISCGLSDDWRFEKNFVELNKNCSITVKHHSHRVTCRSAQFRSDGVTLLRNPVTFRFVQVPFTHLILRKT